MTYRRCGASGLKLPVIGLGGWHNFADASFAREVLTKAFDLGVTHFDFANNYGAYAQQHGIAETNAGRVLTGDLKAYRDEIIVTTKAGYDMYPGPYGDGGSRKYLLASLDASLRRLGLEYVDIFYSHRPDPDTPVEETMGALDAAVRQGKAIYAGISNRDGDKTRACVAAIRPTGTPLIVNQVKYSMLSRQPERGTLDACAEHGLGVVAFSPLEQGFLTDRYLREIPTGSRAAKGKNLGDRLTPALRTKLGALNEVAQARGQDLAGMALNWVCRDARVTGVVLGASRVEQLVANVRAAEKFAAFTDEELRRLDAILAG